MPKVVAEGIKKSLGGILTLQEINIEAEDHAVAGILGPSGCGKSSLFNIIAGLVKPDRGNIYIGESAATGKTGLASYMRQKDLLLPNLNVLDNVSIPLVLKGVPKKKARLEAAQHLGTFGLQGFENYYPGQLSGGMRQRAALLRTYLFSSGIWLLDEPFASLDAITKRKMHTWLIKVLDQVQPTVLFITHDVDEALYLCDKVYVLSECPTVVKLEVEIPFSRPHNRHTIVDPAYGRVRDAIMDALSI